MKCMIMNYKPYEYELLQNKLDKLGKAGYITNDLTLLTFFKKVKKTVYYHIDFYSPNGKNAEEKKIDESLFIEHYTNNGLKNIYKKHNMYVFSSYKKYNKSIDWNVKQNIIPHSFRLLSLGLCFISIVIISMLMYSSLQGSYDKFMSYGITIAYIGVIILLISSAFRNYLNFYGMTSFHSKIKKMTPHFQTKKTSSLRKIYFSILSISLIFICSGLIEDTFNPKQFTSLDHPFITLQDLGINQKSELSTQKYSGFVVPHSYISLEETENDALYIKEYQLSSHQNAINLFNEFKITPSKYGANKIDENNNMILGYYNQDIVSIVILKNKSVIMIIPSFTLNSENITKIVDFYK